MPAVSKILTAGRRCGALLLLATSAVSLAQPAKTSKYFRLGNAADVTRPTQGGFALIGGGKDLDEAFRWLCGRSGGGDFLIIRATGTNAYNPYVNGVCKLNSVATLIIPDRAAANDDFVAQAMHNAEVIFISGGDQANYMNFWSGTRVEAELNDAIRRGVPIGGTSAGLAVQGEFIYSAQNDLADGPELTSKLALANPFDHQVVIAKRLLSNPAMKSVITDSHFVTRDRMGRLLVFLARIAQSSNSTDGKGIGIDEHTAVLLEPDGHGQVVGTSAAYFIRAPAKAAIRQSNTPLTFTNLSVVKVSNGGKFDLVAWTGDGLHYSLSVEAGTIHSSRQDGAVY